MSRLGIIDLLGLAGTLVFAIPIGVFGVQQLLAGDLLFGCFGLGTAFLMIALERFIWTPDDVPGDVAQSVTARIVGEEQRSESEKRKENR